ncbi:hypothetical protein WI40_13925 [Burkholderia ubonensis]|uniref:DUF2213 domain-containing protein n=1 Tax=Burkholderia ubonensis TaxID=101571 RepID=A0A124L7G9_9BURK|nr:DUF2213 domain-containing protein [Burkholderia ubonensis]KUZ70680.1 hypothetical protein WI35_15475 [Burkholderia ubonensis]KUZ80968.1 hypothetical protein WI38_32860 [Burkholderia ubonensis]KUZ98099.1 hypothetical protein WI40_13925 [Burkholderia ubonensis]KVA02706.1 hypothetical protein WI39_32930 [Burkholderia ubonensis]
MSKRIQHTFDAALGERRRTPEGYLVAPAVIARTGIQIYLAHELGLDGDPMREVRIYRPPEEVFHPEAMASFDNQPITIDHPPDGVTADNWRELSVGLMRGPHRASNLLNGEAWVMDAGAIEQVETKVREELSGGYTAVYDWTPGVTPEGEPYEGIQRDIRGNHTALVRRGRCGPVCRVGDSQPSKPTGATAMPIQITIDGIPFSLDEAAAAAVNNLTKKLADATATVSSLNVLLDRKIKIGDKSIALRDAEELEDEIEELEDELEQAQKDAMTPQQRDAMVADWAEMLEGGKRIAPTVDAKGKTCAQYRREVIKALYGDHKPVVDAVLGGKTLDAADDATLRQAFGVLAATAGGKTTGDASSMRDPVLDSLNQFTKTTDAAGGGGGGQKTADAARGSFIDRMNGRA